MGSCSSIVVETCSRPGCADVFIREIEDILYGLENVSEAAVTDVKCGMHATVREFIENDGCHCEEHMKE
jgi:hypothetical protein